MTDNVSDLPTLHLDSILPSSEGWLRWSTVILAGSVSVLTGLLMGVSFDQTVRAQGVIRPSQAYPVITTPVAGTVHMLHVTENQRVSVEQVIGELQSDEGETPVVTPQAGVIFQLSDDLLGKAVEAGTPIASIAPLDPELKLKLQIDTQDIGQVAIGQAVQARVSAYPYPDYGLLEGYIDAIAPDVTACNTCATPYGYVIDVALPQAYLKQNETKHLLTPGMDVSASIVTQRTQLLSVILQKLRFTSI